MNDIEFIGLCFEIAPNDGWWLLVPAGKFTGRDGRTWVNDEPQTVIDRLNADQRDLPLDEEHSTELKGPKGDSAPARGFFKTFKVVDGAVYGQVALNQVGQSLLDNSEYRYYSPAFYFQKPSGRITGLSSVALTNKHNLYLPALNREEENQMDLINAIRKALGLSETATEADCLNSIQTLSSDYQIALNRAEAPDISLFVPTATHELALNRAKTAEDKLAEHSSAALETAATDAVDDAIKSQKIPPANRDYYLARCREDGGLKAFTEMVDKAPALKLDTSQLAHKQPGDTEAKLSEEEVAVCSQLGMSQKDFLAIKAEEA